MTIRQYYKDAYTTTFEAHVVERFRHGGQTALVLDQTYFYPTSGGQPADTGHINGIPVDDVFIRENDGAIVHVMRSEVWADEISGVIDWTRRFDHMQQHTGQHILSQAFIQTADAHTVSFHLSDNSVTIDLDKDELRPQQIEEAELLANQIIWEDRGVRVHIVTSEEAEKLALRKLPELETDELRLVEIEKFDLTACGGTHVARTGAVGIIKVVKLERRRGQLRVEFACGKRGLLDYRRKNGVLNKLAAELTTGYWNVEEAIANLREENKEAQRALKRQQAEIMSLTADRLLGEASEKNDVRIVRRAFSDKQVDEVQLLARQIAARPTTVALLGLAGEKSQLIFARAADAPGQMNELIKSALQVLGSAAGGGSEVYAQGGGPATGLDRVEQALQRAERLLLAQIH